jgi:hypothetical protein
LATGLFENIQQHLHNKEHIMAGILVMKSGFGRRVQRITAAAAEAEVAAGTAKRLVRGALYTRIGIAVPKPTVTTAPVVTGAGSATTPGTLFSVTPGVYAGSPTVTRQWKKGAADIPGATGLTLDTTGMVAGDSITCVETAINAGGSVISTSNAVVITAP